MPSIDCPTCNRTLRVADKFAGKKVKCPGCGGVLQVPSEEIPEAEVVEEPRRPATRRRRSVAPPKKQGVSATKVILIVVGVGASVCVLVAVAVAFIFGGLGGARRASNERNASASLKSIVTAEENLRSNDLDRNQVSDYWTADVAGLYCIQVRATANAIAALNDIGVASADLYRHDDGFANENVEYNPHLLLMASPKSGYAYQALIEDGQKQPYAADTGDGFRVHNFGNYGFMAMPVIWGETGNFCFIVSEGASVYRRDFGKATRGPVFGVQQREFDGKTMCDFPSLKELDEKWLPLE